MPTKGRHRYSYECRRANRVEELPRDPFAGPASAQPMFRRPASICLSGPNEVFVPVSIGGILAGLTLPDCASAEPIRPSSAAATVIAAVPRKRRRFLLISSEILIARIFESPR